MARLWRHMAALQLLGIAGFLRRCVPCMDPRVAGTWMHRSDPCPVPPQTHPSRCPTDLFRFNIDVSTCEKCGGEAKIIVSIEEQAVIDKILCHLQAKGILEHPSELLPAARASPDSDWFVSLWVSHFSKRHSNRKIGWLEGQIGHGRGWIQPKIR
jgi:hypothetical protein